MMTDDDDEPKPPVDKKKLKQQIENLKMDKRVGLYTSDPSNPTRGIFKAPRQEQKAYRKKLRSQISDLRDQD